MSISVIPKNSNVPNFEFPNAFWSALCVETPISEIMECQYTDHGTIQYEHDGFVGGPITEQEALQMHDVLSEYVKTEEYNLHRYFADRQEQMEMMLNFLPMCGGFKMVH